MDGLRALAIVSVVGYHATPANVPGGFVGVDVFFVISGFLITSLLHKDIAGGTFSLADFLARRARRIVPALACVILVSFAAAYFIMSSEEMSEFGRSLASSALFGANFHFYGTTDYFALEAARAASAAYLVAVDRGAVLPDLAATAAFFAGDAAAAQ